MDPESFQNIVDNLKAFCEGYQGGYCEGCPEEELCDLLRGRGLLVFGDENPIAQEEELEKFDPDDIPF